MRGGRWLVAVLVLAMLCAGLVVRFFVRPDIPPVGPSDAVVLLAGDSSARLPVALRLADTGPRVLVVSASPGPDNAQARALCGSPGALTVYCFDVGDGGTREEARAIGRLAAAHGWRRITVVTSTYHVARAGLLVGRCTSARVQVAAAAAPIPLRRWVGAVAHETQGLLVAEVLRSC